MKIGVIGAPGTGKSALATALAKELGDGATIIDGYAQEFSAKWDVAIGVLADYRCNVALALERHFQERYVGLTPTQTHVITCGTLIETAVYVAMNFASLANVSDEETRQAMAPQMDSTLRMMAALYEDTFAYDLAFYLPHLGADADAEWMDKQLQGALGGFELIPVTTLAPEDRVERALEAIHAVQAG